ncbi:hypothetical protein C0J52_06129 [Blattella germanica]|nr:hypothetical protein C0J52_06129 [Blattella germanica]
MLFLGVVLLFSASGRALEVPFLGAAPTLQSLQNTLKLLSAESVNTARAAAVPVLDLVNQTATEAHSALEDLSVETLKSVSNPVSAIENFTQEAIVRVDAAAGEVANCFYSVNTLQCLFDMVREMMQEVEDLSRTIAKQAVGTEETVTHITEYVQNCAKNQVEVATNFLQKLDIASCNQGEQENA